MVVDRNHIESVGTERLEHRNHFLCQHSHITGDLGVGISTEESSPRVEAHASVDRRTHLLEIEVVPSDRNLINRPTLLTFMANQLCDVRSIDLTCGDVGTPS